MSEEDSIDQQMKDLIPRQFWTKLTATGEMAGYGTEDGYDKIVVKSYIDRFWGVRSGRLFSSSERAGPWEKFKPLHQGGNLISLMTDGGTYVSCDNGGLFD